MSRASDIWARIRALHVTRRAALALVAPVPLLVWLPAAWPWVVAIAWGAGWLLAVRRDLRECPRPGQMSARRTLPVKMSIGVPNPVRIDIANDAPVAARILGRETPPPGFAGERAFGPFVVPPGTAAAVRLSFTPPSRGEYEFGPVALRAIGPYGLAGRHIELPIGERVRVYPDITAVHGYSLLARKGALHEIGMRSTRLVGVGTEFESLRDYQDGDDYRDIDWKATARRGAPVVRSFEAERSQTVMLAVDAGRLMTPKIGELSKLDRAVNAALLLSYLAVKAGDNVGLLVFGRDVRSYLPPRKGHRQFLAVLEALYAVEERVEEPDYADALRYLAAKVSRRSLVVLFTELVGIEPSRRLIGVLGSLSPRHLPLVVTQRNQLVEELAASVPDTEAEAYRSAVAQELLHDKSRALSVLRSRGALVLDVVPEQLSVASVNRYLEIKARGRL